MRLILAFSLFAVALACLVDVNAAEESKKMSEMLSAADIVGEIDAKLKTIEADLADNEKFLAAKNKAIPQNGGVLAILAQAIVEHDEECPLKPIAPALRDAGTALSHAKTFEEAKTAYETAKKARDGEGAGESTADWAKLSPMGGVMSEVNARTSKLRRVLRKLPDDLSESARDAGVLALLSLAIEADTHEVKKDEDKPEWVKHSLEMRAQMTSAASAFKAKDGAKAKDAFTNANKACNACHKTFRDHE